MNTNEKPKNPDEYKYWLYKKFEVDIDQRTKTQYDHVSVNLSKNVETSSIWIKIVKNLNNYNDSYYKLHRSNLFIERDYSPEIHIKEYDKFFEKSYRKNVLQNKSWPEPPKWGEPETQGWILPANWYHSINDIVRTTIVVKYIDGVEFLVKEIDKLCRENGIVLSKSCEAKEEGYYAAHLYLKLDCEIPDYLTWNTTSTEVYFEIQIMTEIQDLIKSLLHKYYEDKRIKDIDDLKKVTKNWQWDHKCDEFATNYLGHILHYVEGMIVKIRDKEDEV